MYNLKYCGCTLLTEHNLYFTHISKTGGTFLLRNFIQPLFSKRAELTINNTKDKIGFSIIRNPYDWYVSMYYYSKNQNFKNLSFISDINITLQNFCDILLDPFNNIDINVLKKGNHDFDKYLVYVLENCKLNIGMYTIEYIWRICYNYDILFTCKSIDELQKNLVENNTVKYWLKTETLDIELPKFFKVGFNLNIDTKNKNRFETKGKKTQELLQETKDLIIDKEKIIFDIHYSDTM